LEHFFLNSGKKHAQWSDTNTQGAIAFLVAGMIFTSTEALPTFLETKSIFLRERASNYFKIIPFIIAPWLVMIPLLFIIAVHISYIFYWLVGLHAAADAFFFFVWIIFSTLFTANCFVVFISVVAPNYAVAGALCSALFAFMFLFSGEFIRRTDIPDYWIWFHYLSLFKYPIEAALSNHYNYIECAQPVFFNNTFINCTETGKQVLQGLAIQPIGKGWMVAILLAYGVFYRFLYYLIIRFFQTPSRT